MRAAAAAARQLQQLLLFLRAIAEWLGAARRERGCRKKGETATPVPWSPGSLQGRSTAIHDANRAACHKEPNLVVVGANGGASRDKEKGNEEERSGAETRSHRPLRDRRRFTMLLLIVNAYL